MSQKDLNDRAIRLMRASDIETIDGGSVRKYDYWPEPSTQITELIHKTFRDTPDKFKFVETTSHGRVVWTCYPHGIEANRQRYWDELIGLGVDITIQPWSGTDELGRTYIAVKASIYLPDGESLPAHEDMESQVLYRMFDDAGELLYVGVSKSALRRMAEHLETKPWINQVANTTFEHYPTRHAVLTAERKAIRNELPRYNIQHAKVCTA